MVNQSIIETAERFTKLIPAEWDVKKAYLFGSYAKGNEREESDIDIAVVLGNMPDFFDAQKQLMRLRRKIDLRIEPHPISENEFNASNPYALEIQNTGIELSIQPSNQLASEPETEYKITNMETISIQVNNPKAMQLIKNLADLKLITIQPKKVDFWETMTDQKQMEVEKSLLEIEKGETVDYEAVMSKHRK